MEWTDFGAIILEGGPLIIAVFILSMALFLFLWIAIRVLIPGMRQTIAMFQAQHTVWEDLYERVKTERTERIQQLENDLGEFRQDLREKETQIANLIALHDAMQKANEEKDTQIEKLLRDIGQLQAEHSDLLRKYNELNPKYTELLSSEKTWRSRAEAAEARATQAETRATSAEKRAEELLVRVQNVENHQMGDTKPLPGEKEKKGPEEKSGEAKT